MPDPTPTPVPPPELERAFTPPITGADGNEIPGSIAAIETVTLGGFEQTITLRRVDTTNPVLLFLHGGPGVADASLYTYQPMDLHVEIGFPEMAKQ